MQRPREDPIPPVVWIVIAGAFVLVIASADGAAQLIAQVAVMLALLALYVVVRVRRGR